MRSLQVLYNCVSSISLSNHKDIQVGRRVVLSGRIGFGFDGYMRILTKNSRDGCLMVVSVQ